MLYYSILRPIAPGSYPKRPDNKPIGFTNYNERTYISLIDRMAWGEIEYPAPLTAAEAEEYDLVPAPDEMKQKINDLTNKLTREIQYALEDIVEELKESSGTNMIIIGRLENALDLIEDAVWEMDRATD